MAYTSNQSNSWQKYRVKAYDRLEVEVPKGERERYKLHAERVGKPLRRLIMDLIEEDIKRVDADLGEDLARKSLKVADNPGESC